MPVSMVCDTATTNVSTALRESLSVGGNCPSSVNNTSDLRSSALLNGDDGDSLQDALVASTKRVLLSKIDYEEVSGFGSMVLDNFKAKYIVLQKSERLNGNNISYKHLSNYHSNGANIAADANRNGGGGVNNNNNSVGGGSGGGSNGNANGVTNGNGTTTNNGNTTNTKRANPIELPQPKKVLYPRDLVRVGWRNSSRKWQVGVGMMNVGNTCYLNSTLQALFHVPSMANWLASDTHHMDNCETSDTGCIICAMAKTLYESQTSNSPIRPYSVYSKLKMICRHLVMGRQEDAHEFLRYLVEAMEKSYLTRFRNFKDLDQYSKETTPLNQILGGYLRSTVRCLSCYHVSVTFQHFQDLLLDIRKVDTLEEALDSYFSRERLEDMGYKCESCKRKVSATKQFTLERAPIALCIQLKRFSMIGSKLNKQIAVKSRLNLSKYSSRPGATHLPDQLMYKLVAMVTHLGASQHCGHYTAIGLTETGTYYNYDDSYVQPVSLQNVCNTNAYIIFYEMETAPPRSHLSVPQIAAYEALINGNSAELPKGKPNVGATGNNNNGRQPGGANGSQRNAKNGESPANNQRFIGPLLPTAGGNNRSNSPAVLTTANPTNASNSKVVIQFKEKASQVGSKVSSSLENNKGSNNNAGENKSKQQNGNGKDTCGSSDGEDENGVSSTTSPATAGTASPPTSVPAGGKSRQSTLPSMPNLFDNGSNESAKCVTPPIVGPAKTTNPPKSLVPYETETDEDEGNNNNGNVNVGENLTPRSGTPSMRRSPLLNSLKRPRSAMSSRRDSTTEGNDENDDSRAAEIKKGKRSLTNCNDDSGETAVTAQAKANRKTDVIDEIFAAACKSPNGRISPSKGGADKLKKAKLSPLKVKGQGHDATEDGTALSDDEGNVRGGNKLKKNLSRPPFKRSQSTPPSPPTIQTTTGLWQVTSLAKPAKGKAGTDATPSHSIADKQEPLAASEQTAESATPKNPKNPFASGTTNGPSSAVASPKRNKPQTPAGNEKRSVVNGNGYHSENATNDGTVSELLKQSHRGYGSSAPVLTWDGDKPEIEKEVAAEARERRVHDWEDEAENDMDRGRQKKVKGPAGANCNGEDNRTPGYNAFQEQQERQQYHHPTHIHYQHSAGTQWKSSYAGAGRGGAMRQHGGGITRNLFQRNRFKFQRANNYKYINPNQQQQQRAGAGASAAAFKKRDT